MCHLCEINKQQVEEEYRYNPVKGRREFILDALAAMGGMAASMMFVMVKHF